MFVAALLLLHPALGPKEDLLAVQKHYEELTSFSMSIENHDSSGLYPGVFKQELRWKKGGFFELKVSKAVANRDGGAPDFYANGREVVSIFPGGKKESMDITAPEGVMPGWEVTGGFIIGWLQKTSTSSFLISPPPGVSFDLADGPAREWRGEKVREILLTIGNQPKITASIYLAPATPELVGFIFQHGDKGGWAHYTQRKENQPMPAKLGTPP